MKAKDLWKKVTTFADANSPAILTGLAVVGIISTAVTAAKAGVKVHEALKKYKEDKAITDPNDKETLEEIQKTVIKEVMVAVVPPIISATGATMAALGSNKASSNKIKAISTLYSITEHSLSHAQEKLSEYQEKITEIAGEKKAHQIKNAVQEKLGDKVDLPPADQIIVTGRGDVPCVDLYLDKRVIFYSSQAEIERAVNKVSEQVRREGWISVADFYYELGIKNVPSVASDLGWSDSATIDGNLPITVTSFLHHSGIPVIGIDYETDPFFKNGGRFRH